MYSGDVGTMTKNFVVDLRCWVLYVELQFGPCYLINGKTEIALRKYSSTGGMTQ